MLYENLVTGPLLNHKLGMTGNHTTYDLPTPHKVHSVVCTFPGLRKIIQDLYDGWVKIAGSCMILMVAETDACCRESLGGDRSILWMTTVWVSLDVP